VNLYIVSTDCTDNFRWQKVLGNSAQVYGQTLEVDDAGRVSITGQIFSEREPNNNMIYFDSDVVIDSGTLGWRDPGPHNQSIFMIQYDSSGAFQWLNFPERNDVDAAIAFPLSIAHVAEPTGTVHWLMRPGLGTHSDINFTDSGTETFGDFIIVRYDAGGTFLGSTLVDLSAVSNQGISLERNNVRFEYDAVLDRYLIAARNEDDTDVPTYNGTAAANWSWLVSLDSSGSLLWRIDDVGPGKVFIGDIAVDDQPNIYVTGSSTTFANNMGFVNSSFAGYVFDQGINSNGATAYVALKLDSSGNLVWGTHSDEHGSNESYDSVITGNELAIAADLANTSGWDSQTFTRTAGTQRDPVIIRLDVVSGICLGISDILGSAGNRDETTAITADRFGNYAAGGYMEGSLFSGGGSVPEIFKNGGTTDFWTARLAKTDCSGIPLSVTGVSRPPAIPSWPQPADGRIRLINYEGESSFTIYDISGREMFMGKVSGGEPVDVSALTTGIYFMVLDNNKGRIKLVKR